MKRYWILDTSNQYPVTNIQHPVTIPYYQTMQKTFSIPTISCAHCLKTIERELKFVAGVRYVQGSIETRAVLVEYSDEEALAKARAVLAEAGYAPTN